MSPELSANALTGVGRREILICPIQIQIHNESVLQRLRRGLSFGLPALCWQSSTCSLHPGLIAFPHPNLDLPIHLLSLGIRVHSKKAQGYEN